MHIPTHQIHNVLNAYAKRLKKEHDAKNGAIEKGAEDPSNSYSVEDKRRMIINKISADIIDKIIRSQPHRKQNENHSDADSAQTTGQSHLQRDMQTELIRYNIMTKSGEKVSAEMKILDPDYLITQLKEIARKSSEK
jgi:hypothetical protein